MVPTNGLFLNHITTSYLLEQQDHESVVKIDESIKQFDENIEKTAEVLNFGIRFASAALAWDSVNEVSKTSMVPSALAVHTVLYSLTAVAIFSFFKAVRETQQLHTEYKIAIESIKQEINKNPPPSPQEKAALTERLQAMEHCYSIHQSSRQLLQKATPAMILGIISTLNILTLGVTGAIIGLAFDASRFLYQSAQLVRWQMTMNYLSYQQLSAGEKNGSWLSYSYNKALVGELSSIKSEIISHPVADPDKVLDDKTKLVTRLEHVQFAQKEEWQKKGLKLLDEIAGTFNDDIRKQKVIALQQLISRNPIAAVCLDRKLSENYKQNTAHGELWSKLATDCRLEERPEVLVMRLKELEVQHNRLTGAVFGQAQDTTAIAAVEKKQQDLVMKFAAIKRNEYGWGTLKMALSTTGSAVFLAALITNPGVAAVHCAVTTLVAAVALLTVTGKEAYDKRYQYSQESAKSVTEKKQNQHSISSLLFTTFVQKKPSAEPQKLSPQMGLHEE